MVLDKLGDSLRATLQKITGVGLVDEKIINELVKDIQRALLQSDTNVKLVFDLAKNIKERARQKAPAGITQREYLINIVYEEMVKFLGKETREIVISKKPTTIMLVGLFGSGKTTTCGKLARYYKKRGLKVAMIQTDTWRPAAFEQLKQLASDVGVDFYGEKNEKDPAVIYEKYSSKLKEYDLVLVDTAGRDALSDELIEELTSIHSVVGADEKLLVLSADIGQAAQKQAQMFHDTCAVTGVVVTKLEGTAKGGGALSACAVTGAPIMFIGIGEKTEDLEVFHPKRFVGRLLGMGDLETLLEKARDAISEDSAKDMTEKFMSGDFNLNDLYEQMSSMKKMGSLGKLMEMIPGMGSLKLPKDMIDVQEEKLEKWKFSMDSMTEEEKEHPDLFNSSRIERVSSGSGVPVREVRGLLKQFRQSKKMMKMFKGEKDPSALMKKMKGKLPKGFGG